MPWYRGKVSAYEKSANGVLDYLKSQFPNEVASNFRVQVCYGYSRSASADAGEVLERSLYFSDAHTAVTGDYCPEHHFKLYLTNRRNNPTSKR